MPKLVVLDQGFCFYGDWDVEVTCMVVARNVSLDTLTVNVVLGDRLVVDQYHFLSP
jgi:hypothetical protein